MSKQKEIKDKILALTKEYSELVHKDNLSSRDTNKKEWEVGMNIPYAGRVFDSNEVTAAISSTLDFWLTLGNEGKMMEYELASFMGVHKTLLVNSGSSANLVALSVLTSHKLPKEKRLLPGDEVITVAAGFPTTVAPIIQNKAIPVFLDINPKTGNLNIENLEDALSKKTKAVVLAHALGNPFNILEILKFCRRNNLWLIEDNCDALGCTYSMPKNVASDLGFKKNSPGLESDPTRITRWTGTWGDISTQSFYPPHHLTMGEGGAVNIVSKPLLKKIAESIRDWGRDCWCPSGIDNTCNKRFEWQLGELPKGYDHKYTYSHLGYNLKPLDIQAAIGRQQIKKLPEFILQRKENWNRLRNGLSNLENYFDFSLPTHAIDWSDNKFFWDETGCFTDCSWFGFMIRVKKNKFFNRTDLAKYLDKYKIGNRMLFGGNLLKQPAFVELIKSNEKAFRVVGSMEGSDDVMNNALFLGTFPGLTNKMIDYEISIIQQFVDEYINIS